jgi:hypothetical protein
VDSQLYEELIFSITFDDFQTEVSPIEKAALAQGSPLSPILFGIVNSDLVDQPVDYHGGSSAFMTLRHFPRKMVFLVVWHNYHRNLFIVRGAV